MKRFLNSVTELQNNFMDIVNEIVNDYKANKNYTSSIYINGKRFIIGGCSLSNGNKGFMAWEANDICKSTTIAEIGNSTKRMPNAEQSIIKLVSAIIKYALATEEKQAENNAPELTKNNNNDNNNNTNTDNMENNNINNTNTNNMENTVKNNMVENNAPELNGSINMWAPELDGITKTTVDAMTEEEKDEWMQNLQNYTIDEITAALANRKNNRFCVVRFDTTEVYGLSDFMPDWSKDVAWMAEEYDLDVERTEWNDDGENSTLIINFDYNDDVYEHLDKNKMDIKDYASTMVMDWDDDERLADMMVGISDVGWYDNTPRFSTWVDDDNDRWLVLSNAEDRFMEEVCLNDPDDINSVVEDIEYLLGRFVKYFDYIPEYIVEQCEEQYTCCLDEENWVC